MSEPPIFREEAVAHHRRQQGSGALLRVAPRWTRWAFWALVLAAAAALAATATIRVDRERFLPASVEGAEVRAVMPAAFAAQVRPGQPVRLVPSGRGTRPVAASVVEVGRPGAGGAPPGSVVVGARLARPVAARAGLLRVKVGTRSLLRDLVPGLSS